MKFKQIIKQSLSLKGFGIYDVCILLVVFIVPTVVYFVDFKKLFKELEPYPGFWSIFLLGIGAIIVILSPFILITVIIYRYFSSKNERNK